MIFDERLTELRKAKGINQKECAAELGMTDASKYNKWENGKNCPDFTTVCQLARYFDVTTDYLLGASDSKKNENDKINKRLGLSDKAITNLTILNAMKSVDKTIDTINTLIENEDGWGDDINNIVSNDIGSGVMLFDAITSYLQINASKNSYCGLTKDGDIVKELNALDEYTTFDSDTVVAKTSELFKSAFLFEIQQKLIKLKESI